MNSTSKALAGGVQDDESIMATDQDGQRANPQNYHSLLSFSEEKAITEENHSNEYRQERRNPFKFVDIDQENLKKRIKLGLSMKNQSKQSEIQMNTNIECIQHSDFFCIIEALVSGQPIYQCQTGSHEGKYMCLSGRIKHETCNLCFQSLEEVDREKIEQQVALILTCKFCGQKIDQKNYYHHLTKRTHEIAPTNFTRMDTFRFFEPIFVDICKNRTLLASSDIKQVIQFLKKQSKIHTLDQSSFFLCFQTTSEFDWGCLTSKKKSDCLSLQFDDKMILLIRHFKKRQPKIENWAASLFEDISEF